MILRSRFLATSLLGLTCFMLIALPAAAEVPPPNSPVTLALQPGWNLVSIPYFLSIFGNTPAILDEADMQGHSLFMYDTATGQWFIPGRRMIFHPTDTLWVYTRKSVTVTLNPFPDTYTGTYDRTLYPGWNLVGITGTNPVRARDAFPGLNNNWQTIIGYNSTSQSYSPIIMNGGAGIFNDEQELLPGKGYWIFLTSGGIIRYG